MRDRYCFLYQTLRGIAAALNHRSLRTRRGSAWRLEHVARILRQGRRRQSNRRGTFSNLQGFVECSLFWRIPETARNQTVMARFGTKPCTFRYLFGEEPARIALPFAGPSSSLNRPRRRSPARAWGTRPPGREARA